MEKHWYWLGGFIIVGILLGAGIIFLVSRPPRGTPVVLLPAPSPAPITVYVTGEVHKPGLVSLPAGSRVNDAVLAAGGLTENANPGGINLAEILVDGQKVEVPSLTGLITSPSSSASVAGKAGLLDINSASVEQLDSLPGIGPIYAQDIIDYRNTNGSFARIEDIMNVPGIGQGKFDAIKDLITVGTSP